MIIFQIGISVFILSFIIFVHELFHLLAAKMLKIPATDFAVGFGPSIVSYQKGKFLWFASNKTIKSSYSEDSTVYHIKWIPLGGFVAFGREVNGVIEDGLSKFKPWKRMIVAVAGPIGNFVFAVIATGALLTYMTSGVSVNSVQTGSIAEDFGITERSVIKKINGEHVTTIDDVQQAIQSSNQSVSVTFLSSHETRTITSTTTIDGPITEIGVEVSEIKNKVTWKNIVPRSVELTVNLGKEYIIGIVEVILNFNIDDMQGPVGIVDMMHKHVGDLFQVLFYLVVINVALGVGNLLFPFSITDGGRIILDFLAILFGKHALKTKYLDIACAVLMLCFLAFITVMDIYRLF